MNDDRVRPEADDRVRPEASVRVMIYERFLTGLVSVCAGLRQAIIRFPSSYTHESLKDTPTNH